MSDADYLRLIIHGATAFELVHAALQLDLFEALEQHGAMSVADTAKVLHIEEQPARILLLGLASLQLLETTPPLYRNTPLVRRKLLRAGDTFLGPLVDVQSAIINAALPAFTDALRTNTNVGLHRTAGAHGTLYEWLGSQPELQRTFYANMGDVSRRTFAQILDRYDFSNLRTAVDFGGGDATNAIELARRFPHLHVRVFDAPAVREVAEQHIAQAGLSDRVTFHAGDLFADPLPRGADAVLVFHVFEIWSMARNTELLRRCHAALADGGVCLVYNFVSADDGTGPLGAGLLSPYFLTLASGEGMVYSAADMERAVLDAGFSGTERHTDFGFGHALVVGRR
ncbi:methyltransferase [Dactylosporangium sp. CS-047395]|uniref:methyltransferase n=1 Tax=Dactylosporangium sp. CS-047395 TaxID=3239936 RepID=UPI003D8D99EF